MSKPQQSILIVDDEEGMRELLHDEINHIFPEINVIEAANGYVAIQKMLNQKFDLLITDLQMPRVNGKELLTEIFHKKALKRPLAALVLSGFIEEEMKGKISSSITYMPKPHDPSLLKEYIKSVLKSESSDAKFSRRATLDLDVEFITPFIDATIDILSSTCATRAKKNEIFVRKDGKNENLGVTTVTVIEGSQHVGKIAFLFEGDTFLTLVNRMLGENFDQLEDEFSEAALEIARKIFELARSQLNKQGHAIQPAEPAIVKNGEESELELSGPRFVIRFSTDAGPFVIEAITGLKNGP